VGGTLDETKFVLKDYLDPAAIISTAGTVDERFSYDAFGPVRFLDASFAPLSGNTSAFAWAVLFHAEFIDTDSGLYNYGFRFYHPALGRWLSRDPIGEKGGLNLYAMVGNNAVNKVDLFGLVSPLLPDIPGGPNPGQEPGNPKHPDDFGTPVGADPFLPSEDTQPPAEEGGTCVQEIKSESSTGISNLGRPNGPAGIGGNCTVGEVVVMNYPGKCIEPDCGKSCSFQVKWVCESASKRTRPVTLWDPNIPVDLGVWNEVGNAYTKCK
jgi:RHS repeat-associated protein